MGPTWLRRGEQTEADGSEGDARYAHIMIIANDTYGNVAQAA